MQTSRAEQFLLLTGMYLAAFLTVTAIAMPGPLLVDMSAAFDTTVPVASQLITLGSVAWGATAVFAGPASDAYGRRPVLLLGVCLMAIGSFGIGFAPGFNTATVFSVLTGMGAGMVPPTCIALIGDTFQDKDKPMAIGILTTSPGVSSVVGVPLAAVLGEFAGWRSPFIAVGFGLIGAALPLFVLVSRRRATAARLALVGRIRWVLACPFTWHVMGANILVRVSWGVLTAFFPAYLILTYGFRTAEVALPIAALSLGAAVAPLLGGRIGLKQKRLVLTAGLLFAAGAPALGVFLLDWGAWFSVGMAGLVMLLIVPLATVLSIVFAENGGDYRGTLAGVISSTNWTGTAAGAAVGGVLVAHIGYGALSLLLSFCIVGSALIMILFMSEAVVGSARRHFAHAPVSGSGGGQSRGGAN
ncbi:MAG: MFS transporter [Pseudomonadota bacterium]